MSFTFPVILFIGSLTLGLGMGMAALIARAFGEGDQYKVKRLTTDALLLSLMLAVVLSIFGLLTLNPIFRLMGASEEILPLIRKYMIIIYIGLIFVVMPMVGNYAIRASGDIKTPTINMMIAALTNIFLDPLLIFGPGFFPGLGIAGAALATVISGAIMLSVAFWILWSREKMLDLSFPEIQEVIHSWKQILYIGIPSAITNVMLPLSMGIVTGMVAKYGSEAVAALGVGSRIESLIMMVIMALSAVLIPFIGQNWGAGQIDRVDQALKYSHRFSIIWGTAMFLIFAAASRPVALLFNKDPKVVAVIISYLCIIPIGNGFQGVFILTNASLNAVNKPIHSATLTVIRLFILYIPLAYLGSMVMGLKGLFWGVGTANIIVGLISYQWLKKYVTLNSVSIEQSVSSSCKVFDRIT